MVWIEDNKVIMSAYVNNRRRTFAVALLIAMAVPIRAEQPLRIGHITVHALDVYSTEEAERGAFYRLADRLHIETRRSVIKQFLLFHEGDVYKPQRLAETERNLRALSFLKSASVVASSPHDGVVDITVTTQDAWSIAPETQAGSKGGTSTFGATVADTNFLGYGKDLELGWDRGLDRSRVALNYNDPAFFAAYWRTHIGYAITSDGYDRKFNIGRPFYSFTAPWATNFSFADFRQDDRLYGSGVVLSRFEQSHRSITASYGVARNPTDTAARRLTAGLRLIDDDFAPIAGHTTELPSSRQFRYLFLRYDSAQNDFVKVNFVNKDLRFEDFNLGRQLSVEAALSPRLLSAPATTGYLCLSTADGSRIGDGFVLAGATAATRLEGGLRNAIAAASATYVHRDDGIHPRAFLAKVSINAGWRVDREVQFFADGLTGLRGYGIHMFEGNRAAVLNLEERLYLGREVLQLASPGVVAFFDAGDATNGVISLKSDVGIGIRVGLPRTPKNLLRIDLAYPLQRDPFGRKRLMLSFSSGQAF